MEKKQLCNVIMEKMKMLVYQYEMNPNMDPDNMLQIIEGEVNQAKLLLESNNTGGRQLLNG